MYRGLLLDNLNEPADTSFAKLVAMNASAVGTLWTGARDGGGTKHRRPIYGRCEILLDHPEYLIRVEGYDDTPAGWWAATRDALREIPDAVLIEDRIRLACQNEPNLEHWQNNPAGYGRLYAAVSNTSLPVLFACPSLGMDGWSQWLATALEQAGHPRRGIVNLYGANVGRVGEFAGMFDELYVGEVNSSPWVRAGARVEFIGEALRHFARAAVKSVLIFIAGGRSNGAWDERYIISQEESAGLADWNTNDDGEVSGTMDEATQTALIEMEARQNALLTQALVAFRQGKFTGADGIDGIIVALTGKPLEFEPTYPKA